MAVAQPLSVNAAGTEDVWAWLGAGWRDLKAAAPYSLVYGAAFTLIGYLISVGLAAIGAAAAIPAAVGGFALLGPLMAVGLYEISRRLEAGEPLSWGAILFVRTASPSQIAMVAFLLTFLLMVWARAAQLLFALFVHGDYVSLGEFGAYILTNPDGLMLITIGTIVGAFLALTAFAISALSLPLMMHRPVDAFTAIGLSLGALRRYPRTMLLWAWIIAVVVAVSAATGFVGLVIAFPLLGHATWHAYRQMITDGPTPAL